MTILCYRAVIRGRNVPIGTLTLKKRFGTSDGPPGCFSGQYGARSRFKSVVTSVSSSTKERDSDDSVSGGFLGTAGQDIDNSGPRG